MKLSKDVHPMFDQKVLALLAQYNIRTLSALLSSKSEKVASMLIISYTAASSLRRDLLADYASFPAIGLEEYQARLEKESSVSTGSLALDQMLGGGLGGGLVTEAFGHPGTGKTQLCLTAAATSLLTSPGLVFYIDTKGDFSVDRFMQILESRSSEMVSSGSLEASARDRLRLCSATTASDLLEAVDLIERLEEAEVSLVVVDNISLPVMRLVIHGDIGKGMGIGSKVSQSLHRTASVRGARVLLVSNIKGGQGLESSTRPSPGLGSVWSNTAHVRLLMSRVSDTDTEVTLIRGGRVGDKCSVTLGKDGIINKVPPQTVK